MNVFFFFEKILPFYLTRWRLGTASVPGIHELHHGSGGFLDRATGDVDDWPAAAGAHAADPEKFGFDGFLIDVFAAVVAGGGSGGAADHTQAVAADFNQDVGVEGEADHRAMGVGQDVGFTEAGDEGDVGGFDAAIGEIEGGGGLGAAGDADEDDIGFGDAALGLAVVMGENVVDGVDAFEIVGIEDVLAAGPGGGFLAEMLLEDGENWIEHVNDGEAEALAGEFELGAQAFFHQGGEDGAGFSFDAFDDTMKLEASADEAPAVVDDFRILKLGDGGTSDGIEGVTGGIRDEMEVVLVGHGGRITGISRVGSPIDRREIWVRGKVGSWGGRGIGFRNIFVGWG